MIPSGCKTSIGGLIAIVRWPFIAPGALISLIWIIAAKISAFRCLEDLPAIGQRLLELLTGQSLVCVDVSRSVQRLVDDLNENIFGMMSGR